jgi:hypothetical protein
MLLVGRLPSPVGGQLEQVEEQFAGRLGADSEMFAVER